MDESRVIDTLAALAHRTRLAAVRILLQAAPHEISAGEIGDRVGAVQNTMSSHLAILLRTGLVSARRDGRFMFYRAEPAAMQALLAWLVRDCCEGATEICAPFPDFAACDP